MSVTDFASVPTRRALLTGTLAGLGAWAMGALGRPQTTHGADGETVVVGGEYTANSQTKFTSSVTTALRGQSTSSFGLFGQSDSGIGIYGYSSSYVGVAADSAAHIAMRAVSSSSDMPACRGWATEHAVGVQGVSADTMPANRTNAGVSGYAAQNANSKGVWGESPTGIGVYGSSDTSFGVSGQSGGDIGVYGSGPTFGVYGVSFSGSHAGAAGVSGSGFDGTGVLGVSGGSGVPGGKPKTGVYGFAAQDSESRGVFGQSTVGRAVQGSVSSKSGYAGYFDGRVYTNRFYEMTEISDPSAPGANRARLFVRDNGSGKTQLCVRFSGGSIQVLVTQP